MLACMADNAVHEFGKIKISEDDARGTPKVVQRDILMRLWTI